MPIGILLEDTRLQIQKNQIIQEITNSHLTICALNIFKHKLPTNPISLHYSIKRFNEIFAK